MKKSEPLRIEYDWALEDLHKAQAFNFARKVFRKQVAEVQRLIGPNFTLRTHTPWAHGGEKFQFSDNIASKNGKVQLYPDALAHWRVMVSALQTLLGRSFSITVWEHDPNHVRFEASWILKGIKVDWFAASLHNSLRPVELRINVEQGAGQDCEIEITESLETVKRATLSPLCKGLATKIN